MDPADRHASGLMHGTFGRALRFLDVVAGAFDVMLRWALVFLVIGLIAGILGFTGVAGASFAIAKLLFFIFIAIFLVLLIAGLTVARRVSGP